MKPPTTAPARHDRLEKLQRNLLGDMGRAVAEWNLIEDGDRILVGLSGGKDSYSLLWLLEQLRKRAPIRFSLLGVNLDQGHPGFEGWKIEQWCAQNGFEYRQLKEDTYSVVTSKIPEGKTYCPLCSRLRRGILYDAAVELGCNKIALGHHRDDLIETLVLNLFFAGQLKAMPAKLESDDGRNTVIRPLAYAPEEELTEFAQLMQFPILPCDLCGSQENLQRKQVKGLLADLTTQHPNVKASLFNALRNVRPTHLLDPAMAKRAAREDGGTMDGERLATVAEVLGANVKGPTVSPKTAGSALVGMKLPVLRGDVA